MKKILSIYIILMLMFSAVSVSAEQLIEDFFDGVYTADFTDGAEEARWCAGNSNITLDTAAGTLNFAAANNYFVFGSGLVVNGGFKLSTTFYKGWENSFSVVFNYSDASNYYAVTLSKGRTIELAKTVNGSTQTINNCKVTGLPSTITYVKMRIDIEYKMNGDITVKAVREGTESTVMAEFAVNDTSLAPGKTGFYMANIPMVIHAFKLDARDAECVVNSLEYVDTVSRLPVAGLSSNAKISADISIDNVTASTKDVSVFMCLYDGNNSLVEMTCREFSLDIGENTVGADIIIPAADDFNNYRLTTFIWNGLVRSYSLSETYALPDVDGGV